jgi:hypothetical protein
MKKDPNLIDENEFCQDLTEEELKAVTKDNTYYNDRKLHKISQADRQKDLERKIHQQNNPKKRIVLNDVIRQREFRAIEPIAIPVHTTLLEVDSLDGDTPNTQTTDSQTSTLDLEQVKQEERPPRRNAEPSTNKKNKKQKQEKGLEQALTLPLKDLQINTATAMMQSAITDRIKDLESLLKHETTDGMHPKQVHIHMNIGNPDFNKGRTYPIKAMVDHGCAKTTISKELFDRLQNTAKLGLKLIPISGIAIRDAVKGETEVQGLVRLRMHFTGTSSAKTWIDITAMVMPSLSQDMLFGFDVLGSSHCKGMDTKSLTFYQRPPNHKRVVKVPLDITHMKPFECRLAKEVTIPAQQVEPVLLDIDFSKNTSTDGNSKTFFVSTTQIPDLKNLPVACTVKNNKKRYQLQLPFTNKGAEDITLEENTLICYAQFIDQTYQTNKMSLVFEDDQPLTLNHAIPKFIQDDIGMNDQEKIKAATDFKKAGIHHPSMSQIVEKNHGLTTMELEHIPDKELTDEEFLNQFKLDHLPPKYQEMTRQMFLKHRGGFSKHKYDIGRTHLVEMDIELNTQEPALQKYVPLPSNVRPQVREILDQMEKFGISEKVLKLLPFAQTYLL